MSGVLECQVCGNNTLTFSERRKKDERIEDLERALFKMLQHLTATLEPINFPLSCKICEAALAVLLKGKTEEQKRNFCTK